MLKIVSGIVENIVRKGRNTNYLITNFLLFPKLSFQVAAFQGSLKLTNIFSLPQCFLTFPYQISFFLARSTNSSADALHLDQSKILLFGDELTLYKTTKFWT